MTLRRGSNRGRVGGVRRLGGCRPILLTQHDILKVLLSTATLHPNIRLAGGDLHRKGRVEVLLDGEWGTICDDDWDYNDAFVFCRQLGFKDVDKVRRDAFFGEGTGQIFIDGIECDGTERSITDCPYTSNHNCIHSEDAGVVCTSGKRLD
ncbi:hypothetical protein BSL78_23081 [Apostichopus japonicus]|uniref:SRCR domain-containing protein n=1 Tax=Stichopus japonicus TaxID=307972 RepID=A0A2G8JWM2_STIJA|nr:hypothetical protein BSL78_23081 [Apostichopus japonicus]